MSFSATYGVAVSTIWDRGSDPTEAVAAIRKNAMDVTNPVVGTDGSLTVDVVWLPDQDPMSTVFEVGQILFQEVVQVACPVPSGYGN